jgi:hypothetical protein
LFGERDLKFEKGESKEDIQLPGEFSKGGINMETKRRSVVAQAKHLPMF